jgi:hypothetical protein
MRFVLRTAAAVLPAQVKADSFCGGLQGTGPPRLADRVDVQRKALVVPRFALRLREWERRMRTIGYLDEGYPAAQLWLSDWEHLGMDEVAVRAEAVTNEIEPLKV